MKKLIRYIVIIFVYFFIFLIINLGFGFAKKFSNVGTKIVKSRNNGENFDHFDHPYDQVKNYKSTKINIKIIFLPFI